MLDTLSERAATRFVETTDDPGYQTMQVGRDWDSFLAFIAQLFEMLMPIFEKCLVSNSPREIIERATRWEDVMPMTRRQRRRQIGVMENLLLSRWERQMGRQIDDEVGEEFDNDEICEAVVHTIAEATEQEVAALGADAARLRAEND